MFPAARGAEVASQSAGGQGGSKMEKGDHAKTSSPKSRAFEFTIAGVVLLIVAGAVSAVAVTRRDLAPARRHASQKVAHHLTAPLTLVSTTPGAGATSVAFRPRITLTFSSPIAKHSILPVLSPPVPGRWSRPTADTLAFEPSAELSPLEHVSVEVPGGLRATDGSQLGSVVAWHFTVRDASVLRLQQLLSELGYLPVAFEPSSLVTTRAVAGKESAPVSPGGRSATSALAAEPTTPDAIPLAPLPGTFAWRYPAMPTQLSALWAPGNFNVVTQGAVMAFEADHGLSIDGVAGPILWRALLGAVAHRDDTTRPYAWIVITETEPETLYVWRAGHVIYQSLTNTGIAAAPTQLGTWPVYLRFSSTTMSGYNPNGSYYSDPGVPWVAYFHGGDAVHGFWRSSWGFPQSLGCVELPVSNAAVVYPYDTYGTLVTVTTGNLSTEFGTKPA
jgi:peptidoglycan hydrolase-like protein with peptidoglycan-binding domain